MLHTSNFVHVLQWQTQGLVCGALWWINVVQSLQQSGSCVGLLFLLFILLLDFPVLKM